jgi:hypothetical protein
MNDFSEDTLENELLMVYKFFPDPKNPKNTYFVTDLNFQFSGIYDEDIYDNKVNKKNFIRNDKNKKNNFLIFLN